MRQVSEVITELDDAEMSIDAWLAAMQKLRDKYSGETILSVDASFNNVEFKVWIDAVKRPD